MKNYGKLINPSTLEFERILPGPIQTVWEYVVDADKRALWFAGGTTDLRPNGKMELVFRNSHLSSPPEPTPDKYKEYGDGFTSIATITEVNEPYLLKFNWDNSLVTIELEELESGEVKLKLTHERLSDDKDTRVGTLAGWHTHLGILVDLLNGNESSGFWKVHMQYEDEYGKLIS